MYNKLTRAGILLRPGRKEQNTVNEIEKALESLSDENLDAFIAYLENLISSRDTEPLP